ncbi:MAG: hydrogenase maturation protease [Planctomycetota bacterium]|jgi:hydrogenase maturation protease
MRTLILALGNPILSDDRIGWEVADRLAERTGQIDIIKSSGATMDIIPKLAGYEQVVVIDAVKFGSVSPGQVHRFSLDDLAGTVRPSSPHDINFATAFKMAKQWGYNELLKFSENCTPQVAEKLDEIVEYIANDLPH